LHAPVRLNRATAGEDAGGPSGLFQTTGADQIRGFTRLNPEDTHALHKSGTPQNQRLRFHNRRIRARQFDRARIGV
jgi:hypothetical protein